MVSNKSSSSNYLDFGNGFQGLGKPYSLQLSDIQMHPLKDFLGYAHLLNVTGTLNILNRLKTEDGTIFFSLEHMVELRCVIHLQLNTVLMQL